MGGTIPLSVDRSTVRKKNLRTKYLKYNGIKDTCSLTDKQTKRTYIHSDCSEQNNEMPILLDCDVVSYDTFCHKTTRGIF